MKSLLMGFLLILLVGCSPSLQPAATATCSSARDLVAVVDTPTPSSKAGPASKPNVRGPIPTPTLIPPCQPSVGLGQGYLPTGANEEAEFVEQVRGAESALRDDPGAYQRYCLVASKVTGTLVCKQKLPNGVGARSHYQVYFRPGEKQVRLAVNCAIEVSQAAAFPEAASRAEQQRSLASVLSHESTHLALALDMDWPWVVRFDKAWLDKAVKDEMARFQAGELAKVHTIAEQQRASHYAKIDADEETALVSAVSKMRAQVDQRRRETLRDYPRMSPSDRANLDKQLAQAYDQALAEAQKQINAVTAENKAVVDAAVAKTTAAAEAEATRFFKEMQEKDRAADYIKTFEESIVGKPVSSQERDEVIRGECWAQHEERYTLTTIGGTNLEYGLDLLLFLNSPECRKYLNLN